MFFLLVRIFLAQSGRWLKRKIEVHTALQNSPRRFLAPDLDHLVFLPAGDMTILPDQRLRRCISLFRADARLTDPVAFLRRLHHKSKYRAGRARALLARLSTDLRDWAGFDVEDWFGGNAAVEACCQVTRASASSE